jgi:hypothetical protein
MNNILQKINHDKIELYRNSKLILVANNLKELREKIIEEINPPSKDIPVFVIQYKIRENSKYPLTITGVQFKITPKLKLLSDIDDKTQNILYTEDDLESFSISHLKKIMKAIKNRTISVKIFDKVTITDVINSLKILKRTTKKKKNILKKK